MFNNITGNQQESNEALCAGNPVDFKKIYDATMQMLFKVSYRIVNDEEAAEIDALVAERTAAKKAKDFARADEIRNQLTARGVIIIDTPTGPTWKRG